MATAVDTEKNAGTLSAVIVIPTHDESAFIVGLLDSIEHYGPPDAQIIVVDNGSTDGTPEIAAVRGATVIRMESRVFPSVARNIGVENSDPTRQLIVFLDADVELTPQWKAEWSAQLQSLQANPMQITGAAYDISKRPSWIERVWFAPMRDRARSYVPGGNIVTTRTLFSALNGFDARLETGEDVDFCTRARRLGAPIALNNGFKVHHEGFPKDVAHFMKRERWHGTGDLTTFRHAIHSRVVQLTAIFIILHVFGIAAAAVAAATASSYLPTWICAAGIAALSVAGAARAVRGGGRPPGIRAIALMYVYYVGRALSIRDVLRRRLFPPRINT